MIVIGADTHKRNHTLVAVDGLIGVVRAGSFRSPFPPDAPIATV